MNLGVMVTLYVSVVSFLSLFFDIVNKLLPDSLAYSYNYYSDPYSYSVRLAMAALIVVFPLLVWLSRTISRIVTADPARKEIAVRRWLVYITLFVACSTLAIDLITLLNTFLSGEITIRFVYKVLAVLLVTGGVFFHYLSEIRNTLTPKRTKITLAVASTLVLALLITAFSVFGSPATTRKVRADNQRATDLQSIQWQVVNIWQQKGALPTDIGALQDPISAAYVPVDPETGAAYEYKKTGMKSFQLCATFSLASDESMNSDMSNAVVAPKGTYGNDTWAHTAGKTCFDRTIDAELYPVRPPTAY